MAVTCCMCAANYSTNWSQYLAAIPSMSPMYNLTTNPAILSCEKDEEEAGEGIGKWLLQRQKGAAGPSHQGALDAPPGKHISNEEPL